MPNVVGWIIQRAGLSQAQALTGIRSSRLLDYVSGAVTPQIGTVKKLTSTYRKINRQFLRDSGFGSKAADSLKSRSFEESGRLASILDQSIANIARREGIGIDTVWESMRRSDKSEPELTRYASEIPEIEIIAAQRTKREEELFKRITG